MTVMFSNEEVHEGVRAWREGQASDVEGMVAHIMTRTVELVAARGGTMTAEGLANTLLTLQHDRSPGMAADLRAHTAAQGARLAVAEEELQRTRELAQSYLDAATETDADGNMETLSPGAFRGRLTTAEAKIETLTDSLNAQVEQTLNTQEEANSATETMRTRVLHWARLNGYAKSSGGYAELLAALDGAAS